MTAQPAQRSGALDILKQMLGDRLSTAMAVRQQHGKDESYHTAHAPEAVAFAQSTEEIGRAHV